MNGNDEIKNFITVGLFESIQNIGGEQIGYHFSFNQWLKPETQKAWDWVIGFWEGDKWRVGQAERKKKEQEI